MEHTLQVNRLLITPEELSERIGVPAGTLQNWRVRRYAGEEIGPPFVKLGARRNNKALVRYRVADVEAWINGLADRTENERAEVA